MNSTHFTRITILFFLMLASWSSLIGNENLAVPLDRFSPNVVVVEFQPDIPNARKAEIINEQETLLPWNRRNNLPKTNYTFVYPIDNSHWDGPAFFLQIEKLFSVYPEVNYVGPFLQNKRGKLVGVLPELLVGVEKQAQIVSLEKMGELFDFKIEKVKGLPGIRKLKISKATEPSIFELLSLLRCQGGFGPVQLNPLFFPEVCTNDPHFGRQWNITNDGSAQQFNGTPGADMSVEEAWTITQGSPNVRVAILDSGVDTLHPDLVGNLILPGLDAVYDSTKGAAYTDLGEQGHGTACSGIVAAEADNNEGIAGVAPLCRIVPVRVFVYIDFGAGLGILPYSTAEAFAKGIRWQWQVADADVSSNSWGIPDDLIAFVGGQPLVDAAIDSAINFGRDGLGLPMLFSSGNDDSVLLWPSRLTGTIAVGATSMCDERKSPASCDGENWWGGNYGTGLIVSAPGVKATTTDMTGSAGYNSGSYTFNFNGTSTACPNAAGVMALMYSVNPLLSRWDALQLIASTCDTVGGYDYSTSGQWGPWSDEMGYGRVNAFRAVTAAQNYVPTSVSQLKESGFSIYPNPSDGIINIKTGNLADQNTVLQIFDTFGKLLFEQQNLKPVVEFDFSGQPKGLYFINLTTSSKKITSKIFHSGKNVHDRK